MIHGVAVLHHSGRHISDGNPAVDHELGPSDVGGLIGGEVERSFGHLGGFTKPSHRDVDQTSRLPRAYPSILLAVKSRHTIPSVTDGRLGAVLMSPSGSLVRGDTQRVSRRLGRRKES